MPRDINGNYTLPAGNPVSPGTVIESEWANTTLEDIALALTQSLSREGDGGMQAPFGIDDGTVTEPGLRYNLEPMTGWYRKGAGQNGATVLGNEIFVVTVDGIQMANGKTITGVNGLGIDGNLTVEGLITATVDGQDTFAEAALRSRTITSGDAALVLENDNSNGYWIRGLRSEPTVEVAGSGGGMGVSLRVGTIKVGQTTDVDANGMIFYRNGAQVGVWRNSSAGTGICGPDASLKFYVGPTNIPIVAAGAQFGGPNVVGPAGVSDRAIGFASGTLGAAAPLLRFYTGINTLAESGGNAGSDWFLARCNDAGAFLNAPITCRRADGFLSLNNAGAYTAGYGVTIGGGLSIPSGNVLAGGTIIAANGSAAAPSIAFSGGTNYGFSIGSARVNYSAAGVISSYLAQNVFWQNARVQVNVAGTSPQLEIHKTGAAAFSLGVDSDNKCNIFRTGGAGDITGVLLTLPENSSGVGAMNGAQFQFVSGNNFDLLTNIANTAPGASSIWSMTAGGTMRSRLYQQIQAGGGATFIFVSEFPSAGAFAATIANNGVITGYNGNCAKPGGGMWADSSDGRLKRDVAGWGMGMDALRALQVKKFKYDTRLGRGDEEYIGLVAEEAEATPLGPLMVFTDPSIKSPVEFDEVPVEIDEEYQEPYAVQVPGVVNDVDPITGEAHLRVVSTTETRLRTKTRKKTVTNRIHRKIELPGGVKGLNATPMLYAMLNALKELDQRLTAGGL